MLLCCALCYALCSALCAGALARWLSVWRLAAVCAHGDTLHTKKGGLQRALGAALLATAPGCVDLQIVDLQIASELVLLLGSVGGMQVANSISHATLSHVNQ